MKNTALILAMIISCFSIAQETKQKPLSLLFENNSNASFLLPSTSFSLANTFYNNSPTILSPINKEVKYAAFFCKLEVKNLEHYNVWIKFHAGDYDNYSKACNRN